MITLALSKGRILDETLRQYNAMQLGVFQLLAAKRDQVQTGRAYVAALRDWVEHGAASRFALTPDEVVERSRPRPAEEAEAAAAFALGQHLHRTGRPDAAVPWFRASHRLAPDNWTYRRQAWTFADPGQGPTEQYDGDWLSDVRRTGAENYYARLRLE